MNVLVMILSLVAVLSSVTTAPNFSTIAPAVRAQRLLSVTTVPNLSTTVSVKTLAMS
jgi:hypothetical protein